MKDDIWDLIIVGAGPIGSYSSYLSASQGWRTLLIEKKAEIGPPLKCAGLVNDKVFDLDGLDDIHDEVVLNEIYGADVFPPSGTVLKLRGKEKKALSIDRNLFDRNIFLMAVRKGAHPLIGNKVVNITKVDELYDVRTSGPLGDRNFLCRTLIGCDGAGSMVRKSVGMDKPACILNGINMEGVVKNVSGLPRDKVGVFLGEKTAKGLFAWYIPNGIGDRIKLGLSTTEGGDIRSRFQHFLEDPRLISFLGSKKKVLEIKPSSINISPIPTGVPDNIVSGNCILLGDAAAMTKATSGGGIYPGLLAAFDLFSEVKKTGEIGNSTLMRFQTIWKKGNGKELVRSRLIRSMIDDISDREMDLMIRSVNKENILRSIGEKGDIDRPIELGTHILRENPGLLMLIPRFMPKLIKLMR